MSEKEQESIAIYLSRADANRVADLLADSGDRKTKALLKISVIK
jgi:hypothetical protein